MSKDIEPKTGMNRPIIASEHTKSYIDALRLFDEACEAFKQTVLKQAGLAFNIDEWDNFENECQAPRETILKRLSRSIGVEVNGHRGKGDTI